MSDLIYDRELCRERAICLKLGGLTVREVMGLLADEGYMNSATGRAYGYETVRTWCKGICDQRGYRHVHLRGMSVEERKLHDERQHEIRLQRVRDWRERNMDRIREYDRWYYENFRRVVRNS